MTGANMKLVAPARKLIRTCGADPNSFSLVCCLIAPGTDCLADFQ